MPLVNCHEQLAGVPMLGCCPSLPGVGFAWSYNVLIKGFREWSAQRWTPWQALADYNPDNRYTRYRFHHSGTVWMGGDDFQPGSCDIEISIAPDMFTLVVDRDERVNYYPDAFATRSFSVEPIEVLSLVDTLTKKERRIRNTVYGFEETQIEEISGLENLTPEIMDYWVQILRNEVRLDQAAGVGNVVEGWEGKNRSVLAPSFDMYPAIAGSYRYVREDPRNNGPNAITYLFGGALQINTFFGGRAWPVILTEAFARDQQADPDAQCCERIVDRTGESDPGTATDCRLVNCNYRAGYYFRTPPIANAYGWRVRSHAPPTDPCCQGAQ